MIKKVNNICPNCNSKTIQTFYEVFNVPINSCLLFSSKEDAINFPSDDVILGFCSTCGFIYNISYDPSKINYSALAPEEQGSSSTFKLFAERLARRLIETYNIRHKKVLEIGCGRGEFLALLCKIGNNSGVGIDPSTITGELTPPIPENLHFIREYFSPRHSKYLGDLICCRHTLEHINEPAKFVRTLREMIGNKYSKISFFEVPDVSRILKETAFWDIYYEHCSYFTLDSFSYLFQKNNFNIKYLSKDYFEQYLAIDVKPIIDNSKKININQNSIRTTIEDVFNFSINSAKKLKKWRILLNRIKDKQKKAVVWGSGSKCVGFMTTLGIKDEIEYIIDINPLRHGKYIPGVGKEIMGPNFLKTYQPDLVIIMNPVYQKEIKKDLYEMNLSPELISCN